MIFYFTGTGNSLSIAQTLARLTGDELASIAEIMHGAAPMPPVGERCGIVYPVYAWAPPRMVLDFLRKYPIESPYTYSVANCGDSAGATLSELEKALGRAVDYAACLQMPNNFIIGADVDSAAEEKRKLAAAEAALPAIAEDIRSGITGVGRAPAGIPSKLLTGIAAPLMNTFGTSTRPYHAEESCNGCGRCTQICPEYNIRLVDGRPRWGKACSICMACIHHCPLRAIQRSKGTKKRGRYVNPDCRVSYRALTEKEG